MLPSKTPTTAVLSAGPTTRPRTSAEQPRSLVRVILMSGYTEVDVAERFAGRKLLGFIQKPFDLRELTRVVRQVLGSSKGGTPDP